MKPTLHPLVSRFSQAGLRLKVTESPLTRVGTTAIVQLDISRGRTRSDEGFRLWPGHASNRLEVQGVDRSLEQLVLMVHEPRRRFEVETTRFAVERNPGLRVVRMHGRQAWVEQFTDERKRHFLCGLDEQHCFIAQLPKAVSTVAQAHQALRPEALTEVERQSKATAARQGEFFFVPVHPEALKRYLQLGKGTSARKNLCIAQAAGWSRMGRPHIVDEAWAIEAGRPEGTVVLVRGQVRHPDHKPVRFWEWTRVLQNREAAQVAVPGVLWVD